MIDRTARTPASAGNQDFSKLSGPEQDPHLVSVLETKFKLSFQQISDGYDLARSQGSADNLAVLKALVKLRSLNDEQAEEANARALGEKLKTILPHECTGFIDLDKRPDVQSKIDPKLVNKPTAQEFQIISRGENRGILYLLTPNELTPMRSNELAFMGFKSFKFEIVTQSAFDYAFESAYGSPAGSHTAISKTSKGAAVNEEVDNKEQIVTQLRNKILASAIKLRASDICLDPMENGLYVRLRIDGVYRDYYKDAPLDRTLQAAVISNFKTFAQLDPTNTGLPQDGRAEVRLGEDRRVDLRVATLPSEYGDTVTIRILEQRHGLPSLRALGFAPEELSWFNTIIHEPNGIILVTGPTGSGKTTTLYSVLSELNDPSKRIMTAEDPVEYRLGRVIQSQVNLARDLTFPKILRSHLRHAPDILLVGEIRDQETAQIALRAAETGHLVFSTLHTNDAEASLKRLYDLSHEVGTNESGTRNRIFGLVRAVLAQRLVRKLCGTCSESDPSEAEKLITANIAIKDFEKEHFKRAGTKCESCNDCAGSGYSGRQAIYETLEVLPDGTTRIRKSLLQDATDKAKAGITDVDEIERVLGKLERRG